MTATVHQRSTEIRPLVASDLDDVAALLDAYLPSWGGDREFLAASVLSYPWADPELPSLVAVGEDGGLAGFIGAQARRLQFEGRDLRGVCCSHLVVAPDFRTGATGALLLGRLLAGGQDVTWSDSASEIVARMWTTFGGHLDHTRACDWMLVLRPGRWIGSCLAAAARREGVGRSLVPVGAVPVHSVFRRHVEASPEVAGEDVTARGLVEDLPSITSRFRFRVAYDGDHLEHLFAQIKRREGGLICRLVRRRGRPIGWYAYVPGGRFASRVIHVAGPGRHLDDVLAELVDHARTSGSRVLAGRLEPHLDAPLRRRRAVLGFARDPVVHAEDPELRSALATRSALLTQLDSEWFVT